ncbi:GCN5-related N-acetyltransferase [Paraglaciecola mesophila KMM 241]|uniref:GCN5-related N-acetyltransferase n=1 Tax=Paraglaciecola mesophila KMM 241 TaxID=1128912 RepID=K6ZLX3_9ALTE|nr:GNAT family N-acetyltransferase [Paraglaciecola mesophila]GAC24355.1 GCN5-related N-acetyltransferase [Paraglaciecola mesophila KMM 241]
MSITFVATENLHRAARFTYENMRVYYKQFAPDWDVAKVLEVTQELDNLDIVFQQEVVGVMRLATGDEGYILRDLQVLPTFQNRGIGKAAVKEAKRRAANANVNTLTLRVLKISPAITLYARNGFTIHSEDERFYHMAATIR